MRRGLEGPQHATTEDIKEAYREMLIPLRGRMGDVENGVTSPEQAIKTIDEGWVGEEALAIALYCAIKEQDPRTALLLSVNHLGDRPRPLFEPENGARPQ